MPKPKFRVIFQVIGIVLKDVVRKLIPDAENRSCLVNPNIDLSTLAARENPYAQYETVEASDAAHNDIFEFYDKLDQDEGTDTVIKSKFFSFEIIKEQIEVLQKR